MRLFVSIKVPPKILVKIKEIQDSLPNFVGKKTELKNIHLTLKFLGSVSSVDIEKIKSQLSQIDFSKFDVILGEIGFFDNPKNGIIWINLSNCENLQKEVDKALNGMFGKERKFTAHLTIARVKQLKNKKLFLDELHSIKYSKLFFIVDRFYLMESKLKKEGPNYFVLEEYLLK